MTDDNPYAAPQTVEPSFEAQAEALPLQDRDYRTFCVGAGILFWCFSPLGFFMHPIVLPPVGLLLFVTNEILILLGSFLVLWIPHDGQIRLFARLTFAFQLLLLLTTSWAFFRSPEYFSDIFIGAWLFCKCLNLACLMQLIALLGRALGSDTMQRLSGVAICFLGLLIVFAFAAWMTTTRTLSLQHQQSAYYGMFAGLITYVTGWGAIYCAWRLPREIVARMQRCLPAQIKKFDPNQSDFAFLQEFREEHKPLDGEDSPQGKS